MLRSVLRLSPVATNAGLHRAIYRPARANGELHRAIYRSAPSEDSFNRTIYCSARLEDRLHRSMSCSVPPEDRLHRKVYLPRYPDPEKSIVWISFGWLSEHFEVESVHARA